MNDSTQSPPRRRRKPRRKVEAAPPISPARWLLALLILLALGLAFTCMVYPPEYVRRVLFWREAGAQDQARFTQREIQPASGANELPDNLQTERARSAFDIAMPGTDMAGWLARQRTQGLVVLQHGQVIHEAYYNGARKDDRSIGFGLSQAVLNLLVLAAIEDGKLSGLDEPITERLPELVERNANFQRITLRHLLAMRSGIDYRETRFLGGDDTKAYFWPELRQLALQGVRMKTAPDQTWQYNAYHPLLLGLILERAVGMPVSHYLQQRLWQPAGMPAQASWSLDSQRGAFEKMDNGLNARPRDFARFGQLMLDHGLARDGRKVIDDRWVQLASSAEAASKVEGAAGRQLYKYGWWRPLQGDSFSARGQLGQFIYVSPRHDVVIVRTGAQSAIPDLEWHQLFDRMAKALGESDTAPPCDAPEAAAAPAAGAASGPLTAQPPVPGASGPLVEPPLAAASMPAPNAAMPAGLPVAALAASQGASQGAAAPANGLSNVAYNPGSAAPGPAGGASAPAPVGAPVTGLRPACRQL